MAAVIFVAEINAHNLIRFTDICLEISLTIILAKHNTTLDHAMTPPLTWTACTTVAL